VICFFISDRDEDVGGAPELDALEAGLRHADDGVRLAVHEDRSIDDGWIGAEARRPVAWLRTATGWPRRCRSSSGTGAGRARPDAEHGEVSAGDDLAARFLGLAGTADVDFVPEAAEDAVEDRLVAERGVPRIGQLAEVAPVVAVVVAVERHLDELIGAPLRAVLEGGPDRRG
jgi:hypothetical protein